MFGSIIKYTLVAAVGGVLFAVCMHVGDDEAVRTITDSLKGKEAMCRAENMADDILKEAMRGFIAENRQAWDKMYMMAETGRTVQALYDEWI